MDCDRTLAVHFDPRKRKAKVTTFFECYLPFQERQEARNNKALGPIFPKDQNRICVFQCTLP